MGPLVNYPNSLKQLDLSHNEIEHWPCNSSNWEMLDEPLSPSSSSSSSSCSSIICYAGQDRSLPRTPVTTGFHLPIYLLKINIGDFQSIFPFFFTCTKFNQSLQSVPRMPVIAN